MNERRRALEILRRIDRESAYASLLLTNDSGFLRTLVLGVLRWRSRLDFAIDAFAKGDIEPEIRDILRLGALQLLFMRVAPHAAVGETVGLAPLRARGFVNAILRTISKGGRAVSNAVLISRLRQLIGKSHAIVVSDGRQPPFARQFQVVLLDAPCSATGTIRKNPEIKWRLRDDDLAAFAALQKKLLVSALDLASETVVYSTCSLEAEENDAVVDDVLRTRTDFVRGDVAKFVNANVARWVENGVLRLTPEAGTDGFTATSLSRA